MIDFCNVTKFSSKIFWERWELNLGLLGPETSMLIIVLCCPPYLKMFLFASLNGKKKKNIIFKPLSTFL